MKKWKWKSYWTKSEPIQRDEVTLLHVDNSARGDALYTLFFRERGGKPSVSLFEFELIFK